MIFTDIVTHKEIGAIQVYWNSEGRVVESGQDYFSRLDTMAIPGSFGKDIPDVYDYLVNFGKYEKPTFDISHRLDFSGFSEFTVNIYKALSNIPRGVLVTYGELADIAGYPRAARAVGSAMRKNRFMLLIPCHRVVASNSLGGFMTGMDTKIQLLEFEGIDISHLL